MKLQPILVATVYVLAHAVAVAQGTFPPTTAPNVPTQKSLKEIWDKVGSLETQLTQIQQQNLLLTGLLASYSPGIPWNLTIIDSVDNVGSFNSLAFGPDGLPAISFWDQINGDLKIARYNGSAWILTTIDSVGVVGYYSSLAFGPDGQPAISYLDHTNGDLKIARYNGSVWTLTTVDSTGTVGYYTSLIFGSDGQPAIGYCDLTNAEIGRASCRERV